MWDQLKNALEWYGAAPQRWYASAEQELSTAAEWLWTVLQGDFAEEQTTAQVVTGTVISMIPLVDQLCDVRDLVANCKKINEDSSNRWNWLALAFTLIGLFPVLGSLIKGLFKILFAYLRKAMHGAGKAALDADLWQACKPYVEASILKLNAFVRRPEVRKALSAQRIDNIYQHLAGELRKVGAQVNPASLVRAMDTGIATLKELLGLVRKWGGPRLAAQADELIRLVTGVRNQAQRQFAQVTGPINEVLERFAQRLDVEHQLSRQADPNVTNPHRFVGPDVNAEVVALKTRKPDWADVRTKGAYPQVEKAPAPPPGYSDIGPNGKPPLKDAYLTFNTLEPSEIQPGAVLYRVLAPNSADNSYCWMTKAEFDQLRNSGDWRRRFAVWMHWNGNGEYVTYTVPKDGSPLKVWRGKAASQQLQDRGGRPIPADEKGNFFFLEGGAEQLVIDPRHLQKGAFEKRRLTQWGYEGKSTSPLGSFVGVPLLQTNMREYK